MKKEILLQYTILSIFVLWFTLIWPYNAEKDDLLKYIKEERIPLSEWRTAVVKYYFLTMLVQYTIPILAGVYLTKRIQKNWYKSIVTNKHAILLPIVLSTLVHRWIYPIPPLFVLLVIQIVTIPIHFIMGIGLSYLYIWISSYLGFPRE